MLQTPGFSVNTTSREEVRAFYNGVYLSSQGVPMDSSADVSSCTPGASSPAFQDSVLRRINWLRALAGAPAGITFDAAECTNDQAAAIMLSANNALDHYPPPTWLCYSQAGAIAASNSNLALGSSGADAITGYVWDFGADNYRVGHRRWLLFPQTQVMGTGDVAGQGTNVAANATWILDANLFGLRPDTREPFVAWPPAGYVPFQLAFPQWSFALSDADLSAATVSMASNGVDVAVALQPYETGYGENAVVWVPMGLDFVSSASTFPFSGTDTVYTVTVTNILAGLSVTGFTYTVTLLDPAVPGTDYVAQAITGPAQPYAANPYFHWTNLYTCVPPNNPHVTGYQWRVSQRAPGSLFDGAENGLTNFTAITSPGYLVITNKAVASGSRSFYLAHPLPVPQILQLNRVLFPATNTLLTFKSRLGLAMTNEVARVQVSADGGSAWNDIYARPGNGTNGASEPSYVLRTVSLSDYAHQAILLRFNYDISQGQYFSSIAPGSVGWSLDDITLSNTDQLLNLTTNATLTDSFVFTPQQTGTFNLEAQAVIFDNFPIGWGPVLSVTAISNTAPAILLSRPSRVNNQVRLSFAVLSGIARTFALLQADDPAGPWTTNTSATLTTNLAGSSYRFTTALPASNRFYRVRAP